MPPAKPVNLVEVQPPVASAVLETAIWMSATLLPNESATQRCAVALNITRESPFAPVWPCVSTDMIGAISLLLVCQFIGECVHSLTGLPLPGSVIGMVLLIFWLALTRRQQPALDAVTSWLAANLSIMFVPAAVGLIEEGEMLRRYGVGIVVATAASTLLTMTVTVLCFRRALRRVGTRGVEDQGAS